MIGTSDSCLEAVMRMQRVGAPAVEVLLKAVPVAEIMSTGMITVEPADDLAEAARTMRERQVGSLDARVEQARGPCPIRIRRRG
jgi:CBS domain-containing protein